MSEVTNQHVSLWMCVYKEVEISQIMSFSAQYRASILPPTPHAGIQCTLS